jgi:hypothetical protein
MASAGTRQEGSFIVRAVVVKFLLDSSGRDSHGLPSRCRLYGLEIETNRCTCADQSFDLRGDLDLECFLEAPFLAVAFAPASESLLLLSSSLTSANS